MIQSVQHRKRKLLDRLTKRMNMLNATKNLELNE